MAPVSQARLNAHRDDRRLRELYRYFQPNNPTALPYPGIYPNGETEPIFPCTDSNAAIDGASAVLASTHGSSSSNPTLTSFAQLAALQLNAQQAIIR
jgi:hypothetical protein